MTAKRGYAVTLWLALTTSVYAQDVIKIGMSVPLSGAQASVGKELKSGVEAYVNLMNTSRASSGLRKLELIAVDDGFKPETTVSNAKQLIAEHKIVAMLSLTGTDNNLAVAPILKEAGIPLVGPATGASELYRPENRMLYVVRASYRAETDKMMSVIRMIDYKRVAVLVTKDKFGSSVFAGLSEEMKKYGHEPTSVVEIDRNSTDLGDAVKTLTKASPEVVVLLAVAKPAGVAVKALRKSGYRGEIYALSIVATTDFTQDVRDSGSSVVITRVTPLLTEETKAVVKEYKAAITQIGQSPSLRSLESYLNAKVLGEAIKRVKGPVTPQKIDKALQALKIDVGGYQVDFSPTSRTGSQFVDILMIRSNGKFVF